ncbi:MAG: MBL fold metallo-hydrolase [bacterium]
MRIKRLIVGEIATNCYLLVSGSEAAVIDPGDNAEQILTEIKETGAPLKYIINTHHHFDHVMAVAEVKAKTGAEILIHQVAAEIAPDLEADRFLEEGEEVKVGDINLTVLHTPGHTEDSISLLGPDFIFTGDTLFKDGYGRTDLPTGSAEKIKASLQRLSSILRPGMMVYPGHGDFFTVC